MIYIRDKSTSKITPYPSQENIGFSYTQPSDLYEEVLDTNLISEIADIALLNAKRSKIDLLCLAYDNNYTIKLQWTFNGISDFAILKNRAFPVDNRAYGKQRIQNFRDQVFAANILVNDVSIINTYQLLYGRNPVISDFYSVPLHKYTQGRVQFIKIFENKTSEFISMCNIFLNDIATTYENGFEPFNYYMKNQLKFVNEILALTTIEDVENYQYSFTELVLDVDESMIENIGYIE